MQTHRIGGRLVPVLSAVFVMVTSGVQAQEAKTTKMSTSRSTQEVLDHHLKAFGGGDLAGTLFDYAPDAVMFTPTGPVKGAAAMTPVFQAFFAEFSKPGMTFTMKQQTVEGNYAQIVWSAETADNSYELGTDAFVVNDGKIVAHFYAERRVPKGKR
jgi:ketosteroid isomerase-like protein